MSKLIPYSSFQFRIHFPYLRLAVFSDCLTSSHPTAKNDLTFKFCLMTNTQIYCITSILIRDDHFCWTKCSKINRTDYIKGNWEASLPKQVLHVHTFVYCVYMYVLYMIYVCVYIYNCPYVLYFTLMLSVSSYCLFLYAGKFVPSDQPLC